ncbi:MAG: hypothetical protein Q4D02_04595 [Clostridia bacterium]|nr:hypothetical protein [Clostridia bacterium]
MAEKKLEEKNNVSEDTVRTQESEASIIDDNLKEIIKRIQKEKKISKEEIEKLKKEASDSINFVEKIEQISLDFDKYVVFTDGNEQLVYEDGEFYVVSSTDANQKREKKKKEEAKNMYLEYFIRYILNPIIKQRDINEHAKGISNPTLEKETRELKQRIATKSKEQDKDKLVKEQVPSKEEPIQKKKEEPEIEISDSLM